MRFGVEEINNSTALLPNVALGYELYDVCSESANVYATLNVLSLLGTRHVEIQADPSHYSPAALAVIGPDTTNHAATTAALLSPFLVPLVSWGPGGLSLSPAGKSSLRAPRPVWPPGSPGWSLLVSHMAGGPAPASLPPQLLHPDLPASVLLRKPTSFETAALCSLPSIPSPLGRMEHPFPPHTPLRFSLPSSLLFPSLPPSSGSELCPPPECCPSGGAWAA